MLNHHKMWTSALLFATSLVYAATETTSEKRGLIFIPRSDYPEDNKIWVQEGSDLTWYYNYESTPSPVYNSISQSSFEFVPMMWGINSSNPDSNKFYQTIKTLVDNREINITHVLSYNEPDGADNGGSNIAPKVAAQGWIANMIPLRELGIQVGLPACTGQPAGLTWTQQFLANCSELISNSTHTQNCTFDFMPVHWYDNFAGLQSHINERLSYWPDARIWVTEFAYAWQDLTTTLAFYDEAIPWLDNNTSVDRYSYFGAFRSQNSNVGVNSAFLNKAGKLTDLGSTYLGGSTTGVTPDSGSSASSSYRISTSLAMASTLLVAVSMIS